MGKNLPFNLDGLGTQPTSPPRERHHIPEKQSRRFQDLRADHPDKREETGGNHESGRQNPE